MSYVDKLVMVLEYAFIATLICIAISGSYALVCRPGKRIKLEDIILAVVMIAISSLRYEVGSDYVRYMNNSQYYATHYSSFVSLVRNDAIKNNLEIGYIALSIISNKISDSRYAIFWVVSVLIYIPLIVFCRKSTDDAKGEWHFFCCLGFGVLL